MSVKKWFEKIVFKNNSLPAINATSLNNIQDLINTAIDDAYNQVILKGNPIATVHEYYGTEAPENYLFANGQAISRTDYSELFEIIGETCGAGDGETTFNLPDRRECVGIGYKADSEKFGTLGKKGGSFTHTLTKKELPDIPIECTTENFSLTTNPDGYTVFKMYGDKKHNIIDKLGDSKEMDITPKHIICNYIIKVK